MTPIIMAFLGFLLIIPILYFLPLGMQLKGKLSLALTALVLVLIYTAGHEVMSLWRIALIMLLLAALVLYFLGKKADHWFAAAEGNSGNSTFQEEGPAMESDPQPAVSEAEQPIEADEESYIEEDIFMEEEETEQQEQMEETETDSLENLLLWEDEILLSDAPERSPSEEPPAVSDVLSGNAALEELTGYELELLDRNIDGALGVEEEELPPAAEEIAVSSPFEADEDFEPPFDFDVEEEEYLAVLEENDFTAIERERTEEPAVDDEEELGLYLTELEREEFSAALNQETGLFEEEESLKEADLPEEAELFEPVIEEENELELIEEIDEDKEETVAEYVVQDEEEQVQSVLPAENPDDEEPAEVAQKESGNASELLRKELFATILEELELLKAAFPPLGYEAEVKQYLLAELPDDEYYALARLLLEHFMETKQFDKAEELLDGLEPRFSRYPLLEAEMQFARTLAKK